MKLYRPRSMGLLCACRSARDKALEAEWKKQVGAIRQGAERTGGTRPWDQLWQYGLGCEVLCDDHEESAGVKFNDADLIGLPWRISVSRRTLAQDGAEVNGRDNSTSRLVPAAELETVLAELPPISH